MSIKKSIGIICFNTLSLVAMQTHQIDWQEIAKQKCKGHAIAVDSMERMRGGMGGSKIYEIISGDQHYVVRLLSGSFAQKKEWQDAEISAMQSAHKAGIGPAIIAAASKKDEDGDTGYIIMEKLMIVSPSHIPWKANDTYTQLGVFLGKMHAQPSHLDADLYSMYRRVVHMSEGLQPYVPCDEHEVPQINFLLVRDFFTSEGPCFANDTRTQLVHGDLLLGNLLYTNNGFKAIDWEQSRLVVNPLFDVALIRNCLVPKQYKKEFEEAYCKASANDLSDRKKLCLTQALISYFFGLAYACSDLDLFLEKIREVRTHSHAINDMVTDFIYAGRLRDTAEDRALFSALMIVQGDHYHNKYESQCKRNDSLSS